jgi:hypothetical protein
MKLRLISVLVLGVSSSLADTTQLQRLLQAALSDSPDHAKPRSEEILQGMDGIKDSPPADLQLVLPLAAKCLRSQELEVRRAGVMVFQVVALRSDSSKLLDQYIDDLGAVLIDQAHPLFRQGILYILTLIGPNSDDQGQRPISPKVLALLSAHLEADSNSTEDSATIAGIMLWASPSDAAVVHKVITLAEQRSEVNMTLAVLKAMGLSKTHNPEALDFLGKSLDNENSYAREASIEAVGHLDRDVRTGFVVKYAKQFGRLATDASIDPRFQKMAADALSKREMLR